MQNFRTLAGRLVVEIGSAGRRHPLHTDTEFAPNTANTHGITQDMNMMSPPQTTGENLNQQGGMSPSGTLTATHLATTIPEQALNDRTQEFKSIESLKQQAATLNNLSKTKEMNPESPLHSEQPEMIPTENTGMVISQPSFQFQQRIYLPPTLVPESEQGKYIIAMHGNLGTGSTSFRSPMNEDLGTGSNPLNIANIPQEMQALYQQRGMLPPGIQEPERPVNEEKKSGFPRPQKYQQHLVSNYALPNGLQCVRKPDHMKRQAEMKSIYDLDIPINRKGIAGWKLKNSVPLTNYDLALELENREQTASSSAKRRTTSYYLDSAGGVRRGSEYGQRGSVPPMRNTGGRASRQFRSDPKRPSSKSIGRRFQAHTASGVFQNDRGRKVVDLRMKGQGLHGDEGSLVLVGGSSIRDSQPSNWQDEHSIFGSSKLTPVPFMASALLDDRPSPQKKVSQALSLIQRRTELETLDELNSENKIF